jgi:hypothetical protein
MNCDESKHKLIEALYDELPACDAAALDEHLAACESCRHERDELSAARDLVQHAAAAPTSAGDTLDAARLQRLAATRNNNRRRWRRGLVWATAAAVLVALGLARLTVQVHPTHVVLAWGEPVAPTSVESTDEPLPAGDDTLRWAVARHQRRLDELHTLLDVVVDELKRDDEQFQRAVLMFDRRIDELRQRGDQRWRAVGRGFHEWMFTQTGPNENHSTPNLEGELP